MRAQEGHTWSTPWNPNVVNLAAASVAPILTSAEVWAAGGTVGFLSFLQGANTQIEFCAHLLGADKVHITRPPKHWVPTQDWLPCLLRTVDSE